MRKVHPFAHHCPGAAKKYLSTWTRPFNLLPLLIVEEGQRKSAWYDKGLMKKLLNRIRSFYYSIVADKRKYPRVSIGVKVTNLQSGLFTYYLATNISVGGMFLKADEPLPRGTRLDLKFSMPEMDEILLEAEVVRIQKAGADSRIPSGMGVKFVNVPAESREAIESFVKMKL